MRAPRWPVKRLLTMADRCAINVTQLSQGPDSLLLVHGFGENGSSWGEIPTAIAAAYSVFCIDLRGHGDSQWDASGEYRLEKFVADVLAAIDLLGIECCVIAGHSLGAHIALWVASLRRQQVRRLALVEFNPDPSEAAVEEFYLAQFDAQFRIYDSPAEYNLLLRQQRPLADPEALLRYSNEAVRSKPGMGYELKCDPQLRRLHVIGKDRSQRGRMQLSMLSCPLLLVRGSGSAILSHTSALAVLKLTPNAQLAVVAGAGHAVMLDRPQEFYRMVAPFLLADASEPERGTTTQYRQAGK